MKTIMINDDAKAYWYFKVFNSVKEHHELDFAELEIKSLFGPVQRVKNSFDLLLQEPFQRFTKTPCRIQDYLSYELPYGPVQGFYAERPLVELACLARRLAYTREFYVIREGQDATTILERCFPQGTLGKNVQTFTMDGFTLFRIITNQFFLEKSHYISKLSRNESEATRNVEILTRFPAEGLYRIPASATMQVGKRLQDYFAIREEPSLYLTHYMHPYKGKFHPKMVRALLNYVFPKDTGLVADNFAGCGTLLLEATFIGLDSVGVEINPLSVLMSNIKCSSLHLHTDDLKVAIREFIKKLREALESYEEIKSGGQLLAPPEFDMGHLIKKKESLPDKLFKIFKDKEAVDTALVAFELAKKVREDLVREFLVLGLSGAISDVVRRRSTEFILVLEERLEDLYRRVFIFRLLNNMLRIPLGKSRAFLGDTRDMHNIRSNSVDGIVNSPPYSTALDYIRFDYPQLVLLEMSGSIDELESNMIGNPNLSIYDEGLLQEIYSKFESFAGLPEEGKLAIINLIEGGRRKEAMRTYKFFKDMHQALIEMHRILRESAKCAIIIGNNHYKVNDHFVEVKNDEIIKKMGLDVGFQEDLMITRELEKSMSGMIRYESIVILKKP